jgi:hypothetical protein
MLLLRKEGLGLLYYRIFLLLHIKMELIKTLSGIQGKKIQEGLPESRKSCILPSINLVRKDVFRFSLKKCRDGVSLNRDTICVALPLIKRTGFRRKRLIDSNFKNYDDEQSLGNNTILNILKYLS